MGIYANHVAARLISRAIDRIKKSVAGKKVKRDKTVRSGGARKPHVR